MSIQYFKFHCWQFRAGLDYPRVINILKTMSDCSSTVVHYKWLAACHVNALNMCVELVDDRMLLLHLTCTARFYVVFQNGQRRRTPGGVYLFLLKGDSSVTKDHYREIFKEQYEDRKRFQKEAKKRRWGERVTSINKSAMQVDVQTPCDEKEFFLANEANSQDAQSAVAFTEAVCKGPNDIRPLVEADDDLRLDDPEMLNIELDL